MTEWTVATLKEHMDARFAEQQRAVDKTAHDIELRDVKNNEFRSQLADQAARFPTRVEMEAKIDALSDRLDDNHKALVEQIKAKNLIVMLTTGLAVIAALIAVFNFAITQA